MSTLTQIFSAVLGIEESKITDDLSPSNTPSWDSLNAIILISELERAFDIKFSYDEAMNVKNFGEAAKLIRAKGGNVNV